MNSLPVCTPDLTKYKTAISQINSFRLSGRIIRVVGLTIEAVGLNCQIGEICKVKTNSSSDLLCEVVGFRENHILLMPLGDMQGIQLGNPIYPVGKSLKVPVGTALLGRVLDGLGNPIDGKPKLDLETTASCSNNPPNPMRRMPIQEPLITGVRVIDGLLTCGKGQRMGIFSGSGVGKSTLLGTIARSSHSDVSVIALVGERGREVREFLDKDLGEDGLARSVVVVSTSDQPALIRLKAAMVAMTIAEHFRDIGLDVTLLMDSVTRFAMAQREIGLATGEPPASKGYPPSVYALLPKLLERAGANEKGTITGYFTVLVEGDDFNEPICDTARSILDGHIILSRELASRNHYPAIDVLNSVSRVMPKVTSKEHQSYAAKARNHLAVYEKARDLINIGAYVDGSDPDIDLAIKTNPALTKYLQQDQYDHTEFEATLNQLTNVVEIANE